MTSQPTPNLNVVTSQPPVVTEPASAASILPIPVGTGAGSVGGGSSNGTVSRGSIRTSTTRSSSKATTTSGEGEATSTSGSETSASASPTGAAPVVQPFLGLGLAGAFFAAFL